MVFSQNIISNFWCFLWFLFSSDKERNNWPTGDECYKAVQRGDYEAGTLLMVLPTRNSFAAAFYYYPVFNWQMIGDGDGIKIFDFSEGYQYRKNAHYNFFWVSFSFNNKTEVLFVILVWFLLQEQCDTEIRVALHSLARFTTICHL